MNEESILILNMLREGKISAEQADSLLRAVRETAGASAPPPPPAAPPPPPPTPDPAALASMQAKLAELQGKLGELQGKLGAAQAAKAAGNAASLAGKILDHLPRPDIDLSKINKAVDEAVRGLNSLKNDAVKTAKTAARQASQEAKKAAREGRKAMKFDFNFDLGSDGAEERPENTEGQPQASETNAETVRWAGAERLVLENKYGSITVVATDSTEDAAAATVTKTAWTGSDADSRVVLQQVFLTQQIENGRCKVGVAAPQDARERLTVDYQITVPRHLPLEITTTHGAITAGGASTALTAKSTSGDIQITSPWGESAEEARMTSTSGTVNLTGWSAPGSSLRVETTSGDVHAETVTGQSVSFVSRSGDVSVQKAQAAASATFESASGDVSVSTVSAGTKADVRTQSGQIEAQGLRAEQVSVETVSGDAEVRDAAGTLNVKTVSGDITASGTDSPAISLLTVSGDAHWSLTQPFSGSFAGTTVSGDLFLTLPGGSDTRLEMNTTSGKLNTGTVSVQTTQATDRHLSGTLGAGTGSVRLQSVSGDLTVS